MSTVSRTQSVRRGGSLPRLWIDSSLSSYQKQLHTPSSALPSANVVLSGETSTTLTDSSTTFSVETFHVLTLYDYDAADTDQLSFKKNEMLEIIKREDSGWWAALRPGDDRVGWIPQAFVEPISERVVQQLSIKDDARIVSPSSGLSSKSGSLLSIPESEGLGLQWVPLKEGDQAPFRLFAGSDGKGAPTLYSPLVPPHEGVDDARSEPDVEGSSASCGEVAGAQRSMGVPALADAPEAPDEPPPVPSKDGLQLMMSLNLKSTQPLQIQRHSTPLRVSPTLVEGSDHARSYSDPVSPVVHRHLRRRPVLIDDRPSLNRLTTLFEYGNVADVDIIVNSPVSSSPLTGLPFLASPVSSNPLMGIPFLTTPGSTDLPETSTVGKRSCTPKQSLPKSPLVPRPIPTPVCQESLESESRQSPVQVSPVEDDSELLIAEDGSVVAGTLPALIERLTLDTHDPVQMRNFQRAFFLTYNSFATADELFTLLEDLFHMEHPPAETSQENLDLALWREEKLEPMQRRVLFIMKMWFEEYGMLRDEPHVVGRLHEFLSTLTSPFIAMARVTSDSLQRHLNIKSSPPPPTPVTGRRKVKRKASKNDFARLEPMAVARQLCLHEHRLYAKLEPRECMHWMAPNSAGGILNLAAFCMARARLTGWVRASLLGVDGLSRRAEILEFWIRVAEGCKELCNFSSLSAIKAGLSDPAIARSPFLWAHLPLGRHREAMALLSEHSGHQLPYCAQQESVDGPCVPYIEPYLALVAYVRETFPDTVPSPQTGRPLIHFAKREKWYGAVQEMLRHQTHAYDFPEDSQTAELVESNVTSIAQDQNFVALPHQTEVDITNMKKVLESLP